MSYQPRPNPIVNLNKVLNWSHWGSVLLLVLVPDQTLPCAYLIHLQDLIKKLDEVTQNSEIVEIRQKESECELEAARDRVQQQATEILLKASKTLLSSGLLEMCTATTVNMPARGSHPGFDTQTQQRSHLQILRDAASLSALTGRCCLPKPLLLSVPQRQQTLPHHLGCMCVCMCVCM